MINGISVSVSDDEEVAGKMRVRIRHRRKKPGPRQELLGRVVRSAMRWWASSSSSPSSSCSSSRPRSSRGGPATNPDLSPSPSRGTRSRTPRSPLGSQCRGAEVDWKPKSARSHHQSRQWRQRAPKEIASLEFPSSAEPNILSRDVVYKSDNNNESHVEGDSIQSLQNKEATRFNLFTGYQTLREREETFKVQETAAVHCGFYSEKGGFKISEDDRNYMRTCKAVVSTCAFGGGDDLYEPIGMTEASIYKVCYVAFWDEITRTAQEAEGKQIGENHMIGRWRIVIVKDLPFSDQRLNGKIPKMLGHRLFPEARYSIWVDSKSQFRRDPIGVMDALLWRTNSTLAISEHGARSNLYDEGKAIISKHKATPEEVEEQLNQYRKDGIPGNKRFNGKKALAEASVIVREHTPSTNLFMCLWFNEVVRFTSRDQLSFPYVMRRLKIPGVNMFSVCTRKDLVNSMGHKHTVKPLLRQTS
uniref:TOD1/MUCI70 glycosyltransferase-like domain-containing protein n=1 Tax=Ananas comosus var. bracteatus TaxID=296719 RepID=A0A6V7NLU7_ANACO|nr:unnamed protein product [Ananas comosus var. bracteatus]